MKNKIFKRVVLFFNNKKKKKVNNLGPNSIVGFMILSRIQSEHRKYTIKEVIEVGPKWYTAYVYNNKDKIVGRTVLSITNEVNYIYYKL